MFKKLKDKWGVSAFRLVLILCTFSIGGSLSGYAGRKLLAYLELPHGFWWVVAYLLLVTVLWPLAVLLVSIPLGQFPFFRKYLSRLGRRLFSRKQSGTRYSIAP